MTSLYFILAICSAFIIGFFIIGFFIGAFSMTLGVYEIARRSGYIFKKNWATGKVYLAKLEDSK